MKNPDAIKSIRNRLRNIINCIKIKKITGNYELSKVGEGYANTSVNTSMFRKSSIISHAGHQFISYYDRKGRIVLGRRILPEGKWKTRTLPLTANIKDAHNIISLGVDGAGYLHIAYGMHCAPLKYARSVAPLSLKMELLPGMDYFEETRVTYPEFHSLPDGDLLYAYRSGASGNGNMVLKKYSLKTGQWVTLQSNLIDGEGERNAYWQMCIDRRGVIHMSWVWRETPDVASNHDLCYACSKDGGLTWERSDSSPYDLPINIKNAETVSRIPQNSELINQTSMTADEAGNVYIATYWRDAHSNVPQYRIVLNKGNGWKETQVGKRTKSFSLKGKGTKMVPVSRPLVVARDSEVMLIFRDEERGSKMTLGKISDIERGDWKFQDLTDFSVEAWEPSIDPNLWRIKNILNLYVQVTYQGDGEKVNDKGPLSTPVWICQEKQS